MTRSYCCGSIKELKDLAVAEVVEWDDDKWGRRNGSLDHQCWYFVKIGYS